jgi:hypothetical protein
MNRSREEVRVGVPGHFPGMLEAPPTRTFKVKICALYYIKNLLKCTNPDNCSLTSKTTSRITGVLTRATLLLS